jgi:uncharacterized membrane protein
MNGNAVPGIRSTASIAGHPLHPMIIPFPLALLVILPLVDFAFVFTSDPFWARAALWLAGAGLLSGLVAAGVGLIDFITLPIVRRHRAAWIHAGGNAMAMALTFVSLWLRMEDPVAAVVPSGILLSIVVAILLTITGWYGGELSYRYWIGVFGPE